MDAVFLVSPPASMLQTYSHSNNNCYLLYERWVGFFYLAETLFKYMQWRIAHQNRERFWNR